MLNYNEPTTGNRKQRAETWKSQVIPSPAIEEERKRPNIIEEALPPDSYVDTMSQLDSVRSPMRMQELKGSRKDSDADLVTN